MPLIGYCRNFKTDMGPCFVCNKMFPMDNSVEDLLTHVTFSHHVVITDVHNIADFKKYMEYYQKRMKEDTIESFTSTKLITVPEPIPREQKYYFIGEFLKEDEDLRRNLHALRLKIATEQQQKNDRSPQLHCRRCFYCNSFLNLTNINWVVHLKSHGFQSGRVEKLVYIEKFIAAIEESFNLLRCIYCQSHFETFRGLRSHLESKGHFKIHPNHRYYDQFFMINYIEYGKNWMDFSSEIVIDEPVIEKRDEDIDWDTWGTEPEQIKCLLCSHLCKSWEGTLLHLNVSHNFNFKTVITQFSFYEKVKIVNYIRSRIAKNKCINCDYEGDDVLSHMESSNHVGLPPKNNWDHSDYFSCLEKEDMFLCHLEDDDNDNWEENLKPIVESFKSCSMRETNDPDEKSKCVEIGDNVIDSSRKNGENVKSDECVSQNAKAIAYNDSLSSAGDCANVKMIKGVKNRVNGSGDSNS